MFYWFKIFGNSEISARLPSAIAGSLSLVAMYHFSKQFFDKYISTSATILLSLTFAGIYYSQEARSYSLLILLSIISIFYFLKILISESPSVKEYITYSFIIILTAYIHYFGLLLIIFQFIYLFFITAFFDKQKLLKTLAIQFLLFIAYIPWIMFYPEIISR
jgi:mannosyltransferase